jgi:eukaryotic-like serine/threonine-protein kinase
MPAPFPATVGRYRILGEIGRGAMGAVYRAEDPKLGRQVAVKMISAAVAAGEDREEIAARFEREARVAARLQHPNVVAVYDAGSEADSLFLVMELVEGDPLSRRLLRGEFPSTDDALEWAAQAADALAAAHESGVIHRDVKPGNLLIDRVGRVKVSDFGVAKAVGEKTDLTRTGMMVGSPAYMAPEQVKGMQLDGRSDLFSLGVVLFEMILRRKPFPADTVTTLVYQILHEDPLEDVAIASALTPELAAFLRWTLAKDREARIPDARTFASRARALAAIGQSAGATAPTAMLPRTPPPPVAAPVASTGVTLTPPRRTGLWLGLGALAVVAVAGAFWLGRAPKAPDVGRPEPAGPIPAAPLTQPAVAAPAAAESAGPARRAEPEPTSAAATPATAGPVAGTLVEPVRTAPDAAASGAVPPPAASAPGATAPPAPAPAGPEATTPASTGAAAPSEPVAPGVKLAGVFEASRGAEFHVDPEDTLVTIDGKVLGIADDWDNMGGGKQWVAPGPGEYLVKLTLQGYRTAWIKIVVQPGAKRKFADVDTDLEEVDN